MEAVQAAAGEASPALCGSTMRLPVHKVIAHVQLGMEFARGQQQSALDVRIAHQHKASHRSQALNCCSCVRTQCALNWDRFEQQHAHAVQQVY